MGIAHLSKKYLCPNGLTGEKMSNLQKKESAIFNPFQGTDKTRDIVQGAVAIESERAVAEVKAKLMIAQHSPRNQEAAYEKAIRSCEREGLAEQSEYAFSRGGGTVTGPSIRLAEELARCWGNIEFGIRELSQREGFSEMEAFAWDLETNVRSSQHFTVTHARFTKKGRQDLTDDRDIYEKTANYAARRLRSRILAILPPELIEGAIAKCRETKAGSDKKPTKERIDKFLSEMGKLNVSSEMIEKRLGHKADAMTSEDLAEYRSIYLSIRDNMSSVSDWFDTGGSQTEKAKNINDKLNEPDLKPEPDKSKQSAMTLLSATVKLAKKSNEAVLKEMSGMFEIDGKSLEDFTTEQIQEYTSILSDNTN